MNGELQDRLDAVERAVDGPETRTELIADMALWSGEEPELTEYLTTRGFVVEREVRKHDNGYQDVLLHTTPSAKDVFYSATWHYGGPTTPNDAVRMRWGTDALEDALDAVEHPVRHEEPELPDDPVTVVDGDGWDAVAEAELVAERMVDRRSRAEREGWDIIGDAPPIPDREKYDLVEIDADPVVYSDRRRTDR